MKKHIITISILAIFVFGIIASAFAQSYNFVGSVSGVDGYWLVRLPQYSKQYQVLYKFANRNSHIVEVKYDATFRCGNFDSGSDDQGLQDIGGGGTKQGEYAGLYHYPCEEGVRPSSINLTMRVRRESFGFIQNDFNSIFNKQNYSFPTFHNTTLNY